MDESRLRRLREKLLVAGVAAKYARRATLELEGHYQQLIEDALEHGESPDSARRSALRLIGSDDVILARFIEMPELRSLPRRRPRFTFAFLPFLSTIVLALVFVAALVGMSHIGLATDWRVQQLFFTLRGALMWVLPVAVSGVFAVVAHRHRVPVQWPILATVVICTMVALVNVELTLTSLGGELGGDLAIGIPFSLAALKGVSLRALVTAAAVILPLLLAHNRNPGNRR